MIYHITTATEWAVAQLQGEYRAESLDTQGFIHLSQASQVVRVADAIYRGRTGLVLLQVDPGKLVAPLKYEPPDPNVAADHEDGEHFPHLYGALNLSAVVQVIPFEPDANSAFLLPI
jgi:uncharacterized protein (DUF952 family)